MEKIGIVTVLYNSESVLKDYFDTLASQTYKDFKLYVVDNNSTDNSLKVAQELARNANFECQIISEKQNWGIAKGNNIGIKEALNDNCEYILLSNNDIVFNDDKTLECLLDRINATGSDIITPKIKKYSPSNIIWAAGGKFKFFNMKTQHIGANEEDRNQYNIEKEITYTPTCFVLIKAKVFQEIGLMDEDYFVYFDDTDFIYRAIRKNKKIVYTPSTSILHNESSSTGKMSKFKIFQLSKNQIIFTKKNHSRLKLLLLLIRNWSIHFGYHYFRYNKEQLKAERDGLIEGMKYKKSTI